MVVTGLARQFGGRDALCCGPDTGSVRYLTPAEWGGETHHIEGQPKPWE